MPAAAVIPAPIAYIKAAAVRKFVVETLLKAGDPPFGCETCLPMARTQSWNLGHSGVPDLYHFTLRNSVCFGRADAHIHQHGIIAKSCTKKHWFLLGG